MNLEKKRIILATGEYPPSIGGPSLYVFNLEKVLKEQGFDPIVITYTWDKKLPPGLRHIVFAIRLFFISSKTSDIWSFDTYSVGVPAACVAWIRKCKFFIRVGGDFLWEHYVNRTHEDVLLSEFYEKKYKLNNKEKLIFYITKFILKRVNKIIFSTAWQKEIWMTPYSLDKNKIVIIENAYTIKPEKTSSVYGLFVSPSRESVVKNKKILREVIQEISIDNKDVQLDEQTMPHTEHLLRLKHSYGVIIPSLSEVSPNLLLDGLLFSKPFIATKDCGYAEKFKDCGIFVDSRNKSDIIRAIRILLDQQEYQRYQSAIEKISFNRSYTDVLNDFLRELYA